MAKNKILLASDIVHQLHNRQLSAVEVTEAHIHRIEEASPKINAIVEQTFDEALEKAQLIDEQLARGEDPGPLAGVPVTIKVNVDQRGHATTNGLKLQKSLVADVDNPVVANLRKAGAIIIGRTNTPAFSIRWFTNNALHGETLNPRNPAVTPGGSSGGAAAAVAAGVCAIGHGTDIAGSVRYPAYACGVQGLRPSLGRVPAWNATAADRMIGAQLRAVSGPIARSIGDLRNAFEGMAAPDGNDPWPVAARIEGVAYERPVALCLAPDRMTVETPVKDALLRAARALETAGWVVEDVEIPPMRRAAEINATLWMAETDLSTAEMIAREGEPDSQFVFAQMRRLAGPLDQSTFLAALQERTGLLRQWAQFFERYPLVLCPISGELPFEQQSDVRSEADFERIYEAQLTQRGLPVIGVPGLAVATGFEGETPIGVQLVSARFREDILFEAGAVIEAASPSIEIAMP
ncbi:MAG: amidase family protein [Paracoccaceae bacterium]